MAVNKVVLNTENGKETLIDLTEDTVSPETLLEGTTAHDKSGNVIAGSAVIPTQLSELGDDPTHRLVTDEEKSAWNAKATEEYVENLYKKLNSNTVLGFYCIEDVTIVTNGIPKVYSANSNVEVAFVEDDTFEIIPTSDNSILSLTAFPGALGTFYSWLEGVRQFSNILFDMNDVDFYSKWSQGNQGAYQVQYAQYTNCIFWSDNSYVSDVSKRTNYTLYYTSQLPLCYSTIPDNTFKSFYLAFNVNSDPNWGNPAYRDSFAKATWATQVFSYYGARTIGIFGHDDPDFNIVLPKDCRGLMCEATAIENAGTFDAINVTNFGAKSGSWRDAFRMCSSLRNLYIKNLNVNLNVSWSPINYDSISYIISAAANTKKITISVSPYTYNLLGPEDFELATSKNIVIELLTTNYVEDKRLSAIANKTDKSYVDNQITGLIKSIPTKVSQLENDNEYITETELNDIVDETISIHDVDPAKVIFPQGVKTTYAIGNVELKNGIGELVSAGGTLAEFFEKFMDEQPPATTEPSVSLTFSQAKAYEVGTSVTPSYSATFNKGSYTYNDDTGVTVSSWSVKDTNNVTRTTASGSFPALTVTDTINYKITATATHGDGIVPKTNTGNDYADGQIKAGTKSATSSAITGYRNTFYGAIDAKTDPTSSVIRGLAGKSGKALANGNSFTVTVGVGALRVIIAYPATLRDVTSIKDVNGMNAEIKSSFVKSTVSVEGANKHTPIDYKVYILDFAEANGTANKFTVQI